MAEVGVAIYHDLCYRRYRQSKSKAVGINPFVERGGYAMSGFEIISVIFMAKMFIIALMTLIVYITDKISSKRK